ncbi:hypothetical protein ASE68_00110 [Agromyces sp. Leaf222]|nr:hypothetical protein ASE68_00110 [Agromyces sp. Leaf222]
MGRPGLIGMAARTAVVAGTATAVSGSVQRHQQDKYNQQQQADAYQQQQQQAQIDASAQQAAQQAYQQQQWAAQQQAAAAPPAPAAPAVDIVAELQKLAALKEQGILDDAEFAAAKARLLS